MPFEERSVMDQRREFVRMAAQEGANLTELCRRYGISRPTGYLWRERYAAAGEEGLVDRSRRPHGSPGQTATAMEARVLALRAAHPTWGGRKLRARLGTLGVADVPAASTITAILRRHGLLDPAAAAAHTPWQRFEHPAPNELWQLDFKGHFPVAAGRCHPLSVLDDHSRFLIGLTACADERDGTVRPLLTTHFRRYGLPRRLLADNGPPWGSPGQDLTMLGVWLLALGIALSHGRPRHPQTQGKVERFHRTLKAEALAPFAFPDLAACQTACDAWREVYNLERPHQALELAVPASRYQPSPRPFPEVVPPPEYGPDDLVRSVRRSGQIGLHAREVFVSGALRGRRVAVRPTGRDGVFAVYYYRHRMGEIDLRDPTPHLDPEPIDPDLPV